MGYFTAVYTVGVRAPWLPCPQLPCAFVSYFTAVYTMGYVPLGCHGPIPDIFPLFYSSPRFTAQPDYAGLSKSLKVCRHMPTSAILPHIPYKIAIYY